MIGFQFLQVFQNTPPLQAETTRTMVAAALLGGYRGLTPSIILQGTVLLGSQHSLNWMVHGGSRHQAIGSCGAMFLATRTRESSITWSARYW